MRRRFFLVESERNFPLLPPPTADQRLPRRSALILPRPTREHISSCVLAFTGIGAECFFAVSVKLCRVSVGLCIQVHVTEWQLFSLSLRRADIQSTWPYFLFFFFSVDGQAPAPRSPSGALRLRFVVPSVVDLPFFPPKLINWRGAFPPSRRETAVRRIEEFFTMSWC